MFRTRLTLGKPGRHLENHALLRLLLLLLPIVLPMSEWCFFHTATTYQEVSRWTPSRRQGSTGIATTGRPAYETQVKT